MALKKMQEMRVDLRPAAGNKRTRAEDGGDIENKEEKKISHRRESEERIRRLENENKQNAPKINKIEALNAKKQNNKIVDLDKRPGKKAAYKEEKVLEKAPLAPAAPKRILKFPDGFLWGTSTSAYQVEGGIMNDWSQWEKDGRRILKLEKKGKNPDDYICGSACDSYNRWEEDLDLTAGLNNNAIRFGLEWARIQPKRDTWDTEAIAHYRRVLGGAKKRGLKTVVTLWHWTLPTWISGDGGWNNKQTINYFLKYIDLIIKELGADIDYWVVLNEPIVHIANGYLTAKFPPSLHRPLKAYKAFKNLAAAHNKSYSLIHKHYSKAWVSITQIVNYIEPARKWCPIEWALSKIFNYLINLSFLNKIKNNIDYIGVDYYFHDRVVWYPPFKKNKNKKVTDIGWEIFPQGIYYVLKILTKYKKPILILENGLADAKDKYRANFIREHLYWIHKAISEGADVRGYFYWSLLDNFEWDKGYLPKFGLYAVNRKTFERTPKPSAEVYRDICKANKLQI